MFKDLFIAIAAGVIGLMPVPSTPDVVVPVDTVEFAVAQFIEVKEDVLLKVDCGLSVKEIRVKEASSEKFTCVATDLESKGKFSTVVTLTALEGKITISAEVKEENIPVTAESDESTELQPVSPEKE